MRMLPFFALAVVSIAAGADETTRATLTVQVEVDPAGDVIAVELPAALHHSLADRLRGELGGWRFAACDGDSTRTNEVELGLTAHEADDGVVMRIAYANAGERIMPDTRGRTPRYPSGALQHGVEGMVFVRLRIGDDGSVVDAHATRTGVAGVRMSETRQRYWRTRFERAALAGSRHWRFDTAVVPPGATVGYQVTFQLGEADLSHWRTYSYGPETPAPWQVERVMDASTLQASDCSRLLTDVVGRTL